MARRGFVGLIFLLFLWGCTQAPITGRSQFIVISESHEVGLGADAYRHILRENVISTNADAVRIVRKVGLAIARAAQKPEYKWEFNVIDDPEMVNAFAVPGGKVAVYTGIFPLARDETGLAVVLGHEVAHALARHAGERISQGLILQLGGVGLSVALGSNPQLADQVLQAYGLGAQVGLVLPFGRSQESEADRIGLTLMAKAGYDPRASLAVWERMEEKSKGAPPEFLSTHPSYETRTQNLKRWIPEALKFFVPSSARVEPLPSLDALESSAGKSERELIQRMQVINRQARDARGERAVVEALAGRLRMSAALVFDERRQLGLGYGQYGALRAIAVLGRASFRRVLADYERGMSWTELAESYDSRLTEIAAWLVELRRVAVALQGQNPGFQAGRR
jgi:predicted Zn-dependent protease